MLGVQVTDMHRIILLVVICSSAVFQSCRKSETVVEPIDYDKITVIRFAEHVQPLLTRSCAVGGCHDGSTRAAGLNLSSWSEVVKGSTYGEVLIPFIASRSLLTTLFDGTPLRKAHPPITTNALSASEVNFLKRWINEGAKNDQGQVPYAGAMRKVYVPNQGEDNVAIIDVDNLVVYKYVDVGRLPSIEGPHFIAADQNRWYVSLVAANQVWQFDARTDTLLKIGTVQGSPALLALNTDGSKLYVSQFSALGMNMIWVMNTSTMTLARTITVWRMPHGLRMNNNGTRLYVANMMSDNISVVDVLRDSVIETIPLAYDVNPFAPPKYMPIEIAVSPNDSLILVSCSETQEVRMFNAMTYALIDSFQVGDQPWHLQFTPDGEFCYVANRRGNSVSVIHIPMRLVMSTITTPNQKYLDYPHGCDVSRDGRYVFISNENVGQQFQPRYNREYVGNVCVIDKFSNQIIKVLEVGKLPTGLSVGPY